MSVSKIRKPVFKLDLEDFILSPVWEFALDEEGEPDQDETTVRPYSRPGAPPVDGMFVVRARFQLADGTTMSGYLTPPVQGDDGLGTLQPIILTPDGQVAFWHGMRAPTPDEIGESYRRLGKSSPDQVFPIRFESEVEIVGGPVRGELPGFLVLEGTHPHEIRVLR
ncbi:MAG TPA: hypothetical protein VES67_23325 [Vicinamibacterales bacterium]|nr:hypothetical protein [Vicinamibacterales bacterium]